MDKIEIKEDCKIIDARNAMLNGSYFNDVAMTNVRIIDANLSDLEIEDAQLGGAFIHNVGMPPKGHPAYDPDVKQRPLKFEDCDLNNSTITNCDLSGVTITDCDISGLTIDGILIQDLLDQHKK